MRLIATLAAASLFAASSAFAQEAQALKLVMAEALPKLLEEHDVPAAGVGLIEDGAVVWTVVEGEAAPGREADAKTLFNVASLAKPIAAETTLRLAETGVIALDEPMALHWRDLDIADDPRTDALTPAIALRHQTGFPNWRSQNEGGKLTFQFEPGTRSSYSGEGYEYLARFLEMKTKSSYDALVTEHLIGPLKIDDIVLSPGEALAARLAHPQGPDGSTRPPDVSTPWSAADNLYTTIDAYARFTAAAARGDGLSTALIAARATPGENQLAAMGGTCPWAASGPCPKAIGFGYAWAVFAFADRTFLMQGGGDWGERAVALFDPKTGDGLVVVTNGANGSAIILEAAKSLIFHDGLTAFFAFQAGQS